MAAVSFNQEGFPSRAKFTSVLGLTLKTGVRWVGSHLAPGSTVFFAGLRCFHTVTDAGCVHPPTFVAGQEPKDLPGFTCVKDNLLASLFNGCERIGFREYGAQYLAALADRLNRRFDLGIFRG